MIFTERTITIIDHRSEIDSPVVLYRGDKNVELHLNINASKFKYREEDNINIIESTQASYGQLIIKTPNEKDPIFSEITPTRKGAITFLITGEMIDEATEVGLYDFQVRLFDKNKQSRATIPPIINGIEIREPITAEDSNVLNSATVGIASTASEPALDTFGIDGNYNVNNWKFGDRITDAKLNKMDDGIYESYKLGMLNSSQIKENEDNITKIVDKVYEINVLNPPTETGLKPYIFNGDITENTNRIQAIFDYINKTQLSYKGEGMSIYTGYSYKVKFPTGVYNFDSQINCKGRYLTIEGERAIIQTTHTDKAFYFDNGHGWNVTIKGFTFDRVYDAIWFDYYNLEMGSTRIYDCWFIDVKNEAIHIDKQSQIGVVRDCKFHKCGYVLYNNAVDRMIFEDNWVSEKPRWKNKDASIIAKGMRLIFRNNLWVPYPSESGVTESAYINAYDTVKVIDSHFGGEPGNKTVINIMEECQMNSSNSVRVPVIEISNCDVLFSAADYTVLRLFALPANLIVRGNAGFADNTVIAKWGNGVDTASIISGVGNYCQLDISLNNGYQIINGSLAKIPQELNKFLYNYNKFTHTATSNTWNKGEIIDNTITITTDVKKNTGDKGSYLLELTCKPNGGSGMYQSRYIGILSFSNLYTNSAVKAKLTLTTLVDEVGGTSSETSNKVTAVFEETGTNELICNGGDTTNSPIKIVITVGVYHSSLEYRIKSLFDGAILYNS